MEMETEMGWEVEMGRTGLDIPRYATVKKSLSSVVLLLVKKDCHCIQCIL